MATSSLLAILTGRSDLCIAGVFGAGKTRFVAVLLIAFSCELDDFSAMVFTKENVAAKALADQVSDLSPPMLALFGRLLGRIEEGKGEAYATRIDVRCSDRNRIISSKRILIATGGLLRRKCPCDTPPSANWLSRISLAFMDESQRYGYYHEIAALAAIQQPALIVFVGDHRQTPGGLSKDRAAAANRAASVESSSRLPSTRTTGQSGGLIVACESGQRLGYCPLASTRPSTSLRSWDYISPDTGTTHLTGTPFRPEDT